MGACGNCIHKETAGSDYPCNICNNVTHYEEPKPMTNADRIRAMSDEELAKEKAVSVNCHLCLLRKTCKDDDMESCYKLWLEWLQRDAQS